MRIPADSTSRELSTNMTPMIDVVFLLIIFFLVSSHLARQESSIPLELPAAATHLPISTELSVLTINVLADGSWQAAGRTLDEQSISRLFVEQRQRSGTGGLIRIRTAGLVTYDRLEPILRSAAKAGLANVSIAVYNP
jgi:biopolymer transport protein ExbD